MKKKDIIQLVKKTIKEVEQSQHVQRSSGGGASVIAPAGKDPYTGEDEYPYSVRPKRTATGMMEGQEALSSDMLNYADQYHMELVNTMQGVSTHPDERTGGFYIKFPHENGPGPGALFGKEVRMQIEKSKAAAKSAALKTVSKFQDQIEDSSIDTSKSGVYGNVWLWIMPKNNMNEDFEKNYGDKIKPDNFKNNEKLQPGKKVTYLGTSRTIVKNNGIILTLDNGTTVNLGQFNQKGAIKEKDMKESVVVSKMSDKGDAANLAKSANTTVDAVKTAIDQAKLTGDEVTVAENELEEGEDGVYVNNDTIESLDALVKMYGAEETIKALIGRIKALENQPLSNNPKAKSAELDDEDMNQKYHDIEDDIASMGEDLKEGGNFVDHEGRHAKMQLQKAAEYSVKLAKMMDDMTQLPSWVQSKITKASDYMSAVYHYLDYEMANSQDNLMENIDKYKKRSMLMEGAMKKFFEMFDKGKTDEEIVQDYAHKGTQVPEPFVKNARKQYEGMKKLKLELEMSEKEFRNSSEKMVNNAEEGMGYEGEEKTLASGLTNEEPNEGNKFGYKIQKAKEAGDDSVELDGEEIEIEK